MPRFSLPTLFLLLTTLVCCTAASGAGAGQTYVNAANEQVERDAIYGEVKRAVSASDFARLSAMEEDFRTSRARTSSGVWKLELFHAGALFYLADGLKQEEGCRYERQDFIRLWQAVSPSNPAPVITNAALLHEQAWCFRGVGYASTVAAEAWPKIEATLRKASEVLTAGKADASIDPEYYAVELNILRSQAAGEALFSDVLDEATGREPGYSPIYSNAVSHDLPQWGGSYAAVDRFARYAAERGRSTEGTGFYALVYWSLESCGCGLLKEAADWAMLKRSMRDIFDRYPTRWNAEHFADFACKIGQGDEGRFYIRALHPEIREDLRLIAIFRTCDRGYGP